MDAVAPGNIYRGRMHILRLVNHFFDRKAVAPKPTSGESATERVLTIYERVMIAFS